MKWKKSDQSIYSQLFCFAMFVVDLIVGVAHLCERNTNAFFKIGMSFVWLFAGLKGRNIWVDWLGWIIWAFFLLLQISLMLDRDFWKSVYFVR